MLKILLDAGHQFDKRGSLIGTEGENNFYYSLELKKALEEYGIIVGLTRNKVSDNPSLFQRGQMAKGYDYFMSLHSNAAGSKYVRGVEAYGSVRNPDVELMKKLTKNISKEFGIPDRGVRYRITNGTNQGRFLIQDYPPKGAGDFFGVLRHNRAKKAMLLENVFHTNIDDCRIYVYERKRLAKVTAETIAEHLGLTKGMSTASKKEEGGMTMLGSKPVAIISVTNMPDLANLGPLMDWLYPSYNVVVTQSGKFDYSGIKANYIIGVGGARSNHTGYINYFISGKNRAETRDKLVDFVSKGSKNRERYRV